MINKIKYAGIFLLFLSIVISCEKDFENVGSSVISNTKFDTGKAVFKTVVTNKKVPFVRADNLRKYLLGVYNNTKNTGYKKIEASLVTQIKSIDEKISKLKVSKNYKIDGAFLIIPYQATSIRTPSDKKPKFKLDSIIGDVTKGFSVKVYQNNTYLNKLNPTNPAENNVFNSNRVYEKKGEILNEDPNYLLKPNANDTVFYFNRYLGVRKTKKDSLKMKKENGTPFAVIPLNKEKIKDLFLSKYESSDFTTEQAFQNYFRGLIIEATGNEGSLIPLNFTRTDLIPFLAIYYTDIVPPETKKVEKYLPKNNYFYFSGIKNSIYKMTPVNKPANKDFVVQGTAGDIAEIKLFEGTDLAKLRAKNWLINEASLTFYVDQNITQDINTIPNRLFLCKTVIDKKTGDKIPIQLKGLITEEPNNFEGNLELVNKKPEKYTFRITNYISNLLRQKTKGNPTLLLRVFNNPTDFPQSLNDTLVKNYNWNPRMVTLLNNLEANSDKKVELKISYSVKK